MRRAIEAFGAPAASESAVESNTEMSARISAFIRANPAVFAYVGRSILEGDAAGVELFERFLALARAQLDRLVAGGLLRGGIDRDWTALHVVLIDVGAYLLEPALSRCLGEPLLSEPGLKRMEAATEALFLHGIYRPEEPAPRRRANRRRR